MNRTAGSISASYSPDDNLLRVYACQPTAEAYNALRALGFLWSASGWYIAEWTPERADACMAVATARAIEDEDRDLARRIRVECGVHSPEYWRQRAALSHALRRNVIARGARERRVGMLNGAVIACEQMIRDAVRTAPLMSPYLSRWLTHYRLRLAYEEAMLACLPAEAIAA